MSRGRKPESMNTLLSWQDIYWKNLPIYIGVLNNYFLSIGYKFETVENSLTKLSFSIPKGLKSKEIDEKGKYPVISQSKEYIVGYSNKSELLVDKDLPLIIFGDHSKTIKYVDSPFIIGADGIKILKPKKVYDEKFFYQFLHGVITDTKDYGRDRKSVV